MFIKSETLRDVKGFSQLIDHFSLVDDGIVLTTTGLYVAGFEFTGVDMDSLSLEEYWQISQRLAKKLRLGEGWTIQCDLIRAEHQEYCPVAEWPDPVSYAIDLERRQRFECTGEVATRVSRYFLSVCYEPALHGGRKVARGMFSKEGDREGPGDKSLATFKRRLDEIESLLASNLATVKRLGYHAQRVGTTNLDCDSFLRFIRQCIGGQDFPFAYPDPPVYLNQYLSCDDLTGGAVPHLGDPGNPLSPGKYIAVIAIDGFPEMSYAGILRVLDSLPFNFRYCQQGQLLDEQTAHELHKGNKSKWGFKKTSAKHKLSPIKVGVDPIIDDFAAQMEVDAGQAASAAEHGRETFVRFSAKVIVMEHTLERLRFVVNEITRIIKFTCAFSCRTETLDALAGWLATFPGQHHKERRTFTINTENLVHMMPLSAPFRGNQYSTTSFLPKCSPPLFYGATSGGAPFRFHPHVGDVGHQLVWGPVGSGKTTWLATGIAQWFRYPGAQVFAFDKKKTLYTLCKAMGGDFYDISADSDIQLCPLMCLETETDKNTAAQWIELLLGQNNLVVSHDVRNDIQYTIHLLASQSARSLTSFYMAVPNKDIQSALQFYLGGILDGDRDNISMSRFCVFEMDELYRLDKKTMNGALFYIFNRVRHRLTSSVPTLVTVDEFREALAHPMAAAAFQEFLLEGRKLNMAVWLVAQEMSSVLNSPLKHAITQQCFTKVCLPNPQAILEGSADYEALGFTARDREIIAYATPKSEYFVATPIGRRLISLELGPVALRFLASSSDSDRTAVDDLISRYGRSWPAAWLNRSNGMKEWADMLESLYKPTEECRSVKNFVCA